MIAVLAGVLTSGLAGCGDPNDQYCRALSDAQPEFAAMAGEPAGLVGHRLFFHDLAAKSPRDLAEEWHTFATALDQFAAALSDAGLDPSSINGPADLAVLPESQQGLVRQAAEVLAGPEVVAAANAISRQAADVCKVQIRLD